LSAASALVESGATTGSTRLSAGSAAIAPNSSLTMAAKSKFAVLSGTWTPFWGAVTVVETSDVRSGLGSAGNPSGMECGSLVWRLIAALHGVSSLTASSS
jgi:hypothetical protein